MGRRSGSARDPDRPRPGLERGRSGAAAGRSGSREVWSDPARSGALGGRQWTALQRATVQLQPGSLSAQRAHTQQHQPAFFLNLKLKVFFEMSPLKIMKKSLLWRNKSFLRKQKVGGKTIFSASSPPPLFTVHISFRIVSQDDQLLLSHFLLNVQS